MVMEKNTQSQAASYKLTLKSIAKNQALVYFRIYITITLLNIRVKHRYQNITMTFINMNVGHSFKK